MERYRIVLKATLVVLITFAMFFVLDIASTRVTVKIVRALLLTLITLGGGYTILRWIHGGNS